MKEQIKKEDLVKGEWYKLNCYSGQNYLFKFDYLIGNKIYIIISINIDWNTLNSTTCLHEVGNTTHITKATKEEVLKYFPDEKFENEFVLPENWHVEVPNDLENKILLNNWKIKQNNITNNMENKKLIGYKCPCDIMDWNKGDIFVKWNIGVNNYHVKSKARTLPGELVESWEPVYENEFKVGDWIYIKSTGSAMDYTLEDTGKKHYGAKIENIVKIEGITFKGGLANKKDPRYYGENFNLRSCDFRLATKEEIEKATEQVISMNGKFNLTIRNKKVYHTSEDITNFVLDIGQDYSDKKGFIDKYRGYDFHVKDVILSKTGCESKETYLSDWLKVYELIK